MITVYTEEYDYFKMWYYNQEGVLMFCEIGNYPPDWNQTHTSAFSSLSHVRNHIRCMDYYDILEDTGDL